MIKRLGFWNRLALVSGALFALVGGTWMVVSHNIKRAEISERGRATCIEGISQPGSGLTWDFCRKTWDAGQTQFGFYEWGQAVGGLALVAAAIYLLLWLGVAVSKWVWRGRNTAA